jgi:cytidine deaminase
MLYEDLIKKAYESLENAYVPYSDFKVGAALLTSEGKVFTGCNVECASYGATNCAERTAVFKAVSEGFKSYAAIAIVGMGGGKTYPCGICRQVLNEFGPDMDIVLDDHGKIVVINLKEMLPYAFGPSDLK